MFFPKLQIYQVYIKMEFLNNEEHFIYPAEEFGVFCLCGSVPAARPRTRVAAQAAPLLLRCSHPPWQNQTAGDTHTVL